MPETKREVFERWLAMDDHTFIAVFENHALDSADRGRRFAIPVDTADWDGLEIGKSRAPDTKVGTGWKYILIGKTRDVEEALVFLPDPPEEGKEE